MWSELPGGNKNVNPLIKFVYFEWFWKKTHFYTEARVNVKIVYCPVVLLTVGIVLFTFSHLLILIWRFIAGVLLNQILIEDSETPMISNRYISGTCVLKSVPSRQSGHSMKWEIQSRTDQNLQVMVTCPILYIPYHSFTGYLLTSLPLFCFISISICCFFIG